MVRRPHPSDGKELALAAHPSVRYLRRAPMGFDQFQIDADLKTSLDQEALNIFMKMQNMGHDFASCLSAVYLTGFKDCQAISEDTQ